MKQRMMTPGEVSSGELRVDTESLVNLGLEHA
jgi:hypothetical protein